MLVRLLNLILLALEVRGLTLSRIRERKWLVFAFYTQISNMLATLTALLLLVFGEPVWVSVLRYTSTCMLVMTFLVTTCVLVPMGGDPHMLLWSGNGIYHHILCPILCTASYVFAEQHAPVGAVALPILVTLAYGLILLWLNYKRVVDGPYPFFRVHEQSARASVLWVLVLLAAIAAISGLAIAIAHA